MKLFSLKYGALILGLLYGDMTVSSHAEDIQAAPFQFQSVWWNADGAEYQDGQNKVFDGQALVNKGHREIANGYVYKGQNDINRGENIISQGNSEMADAQSYGPTYGPNPVVVVPAPHVYVREYIGHPWHWHGRW